VKPYLIVKRIFDFIFALILLIILSPVMVIVGAAIKLESEGPILFVQARPGKNEKIFKLYKFRSMRTEVENNGRQLTDFERMTKVGRFLRKTSIDELPQLINILKGDMSFIGPRPLLVQYLDRYSPEEARRHEVLPGISGWAQVNGRNAITWEEKFRYDVYYVDHISLALDLKIFWLTVLKVICRSGVNNSEVDTMPYFTRESNNI